MVDLDVRAVRCAKRFGLRAKTLIPGESISPEEIESRRVPRGARAVGRIDHAVAGENLFQINVREKGPVLKQW